MIAFPQSNKEAKEADAAVDAAQIRWFDAMRGYEAACEDDCVADDLDAVVVELNAATWQYRSAVRTVVRIFARLGLPEEEIHRETLDFLQQKMRLLCDHYG